MQPFKDIFEYLHLVYGFVGALFSSRCGDLRTACDAMFILNHYAGMHRRSETSQWLYELKNRLVQLLYEQGYCVAASQQVQKFECWTCEGEGYITDDDYAQMTGTPTRRHPAVVGRLWSILRTNRRPERPGQDHRR